MTRKNSNSMDTRRPSLHSNSRRLGIERFDALIKSREDERCYFFDKYLNDGESRPQLTKGVVHRSKSANALIEHSARSHFQEYCRGLSFLIATELRRPDGDRKLPY